MLYGIHCSPTLFNFSDSLSVSAKKQNPTEYRHILKVNFSSQLVCLQRSPVVSNAHNHIDYGINT